MKLSETEIMSELTTGMVGRNLVIYEEIDSTNNEAKRLAEQGAVDGTLVISERQTAGRGRRGRGWDSSQAGNVFMTLLLRPSVNPANASMLTLVAAMAVRMAVYDATGLLTMIKWPNDLVYEGKKLCGILTEMSAEPDAVNYVVIGIGINVSQKEFPEEIRATATSIELEGADAGNRSRLIASFCGYFEKYYRKFMQTSDMRELMEEYNAGLINIGRQIRVIDPAGEFMGCSDGINAAGELLVRKEDGTLTAVMSGEVSVRGVYGYV